MLTISVALPLIHVGRRSPAEEAIRRGRRPLLPWLFWSAFYGALTILGAARHRTPLAWGTPRDWFLIGTSIHLWYLPFALLATLVALVMQRALANLLARYVCVIGALIGMATLILASLASRAWTLPSPFGQWAFGLAAIPFGLTIGTACRARESRVPYVLAGIACACAGACLVLDRLDDRSSALAYGLGVPLVCLAIPWRVRLNDPGRTLVSLAMEIYLLHPFVLGQFHRVGLANLGVATAAAVTVATGSPTFLLQKTPIRRFL